MKNAVNEKTKTPKNYLFYDFVKITAGLPGLIWFRPKVRYENEKARKRIKEGALVISNHNGFFDPMYLMFVLWYRRHHFICGIEFMRSRAAWIFRQFHCIAVDRDNFSMNTYHEITDIMKEGKVVSMFPEGHVNVNGGELDTFKSGMIMMVLRGGYPIVPVYIKKRKKLWSRLELIVGEAVDIHGIYGDKPTFAQIQEMTRMLQEKENKLKQMSEERIGL